MPRRAGTLDETLSVGYSALAVVGLPGERQLVHVSLHSRLPTNVVNRALTFSAQTAQLGFQFPHLGFRGFSPGAL